MNIKQIKLWSLESNFHYCSAWEDPILQTASVNLIIMWLNEGEKKCVPSHLQKLSEPWEI